MAAVVIDGQAQGKPVLPDMPVHNTQVNVALLPPEKLQEIAINEAVKKQALEAMLKLSKVMKGEETPGGENPEQQQARMVTAVDLKNGILKAEIVPDHLEKADAPLKNDTGEQLAGVSSLDAPGVKQQNRGPAIPMA